MRRRGSRSGPGIAKGLLIPLLQVGPRRLAVAQHVSAHPARCGGGVRTPYGDPRVSDGVTRGRPECADCPGRQDAARQHPDRTNTRGVHLLAAYLPQEGIVLFQLAVGSKENEISAAPQVLKALDLRGKIVRADALLTQRELSSQIVEAGGKYVWVVKDNQPET